MKLHEKILEKLEALLLSSVAQMSGIGLSTIKFPLKTPYFKKFHCIREEMFSEINQNPIVGIHTK